MRLSFPRFYRIPPRDLHGRDLQSDRCFTLSRNFSERHLALISLSFGDPVINPSLSLSCFVIAASLALRRKIILIFVVVDEEREKGGEREKELVTEHNNRVVEIGCWKLTRRICMNLRGRLRTRRRRRRSGEGRGARRHGLPRMRVSSLC